MGVDTKAITRKGTTINELVEVLSEKYTDIKVRNTHEVYYLMITFKDGNDLRNLNVFINDFAKNDYGIDGVLLSLGMWGDSVGIMKTILDKFGGYIDESDCDNVGFEPYNISEFLKGNDMSRHDEFTLEVINKIGYEKLNDCLDLFEKFKNIL